MKLIAVLVFIAALSAADKNIAWETGMVISQDLNSQQAGTYAAPMGNARVAVPLYRRSNTVVIETEQYRYQWQEQGRNAIILPVNDTVKFYRDGNWFIVLDTKNKKHKFGLMGQVKK